jgi:hypothetical protein
MLKFLDQAFGGFGNVVNFATSDASAAALDQHATNLGSQSQESNRNAGLFQGWSTITAWVGLAPFGDLDGVHFLVLWASAALHRLTTLPPCIHGSMSGHATETTSTPTISTTATTRAAK